MFVKKPVKERKYKDFTESDPEFAVGGGANPPERSIGVNIRFLPNFAGWGVLDPPLFSVVELRGAPPMRPPGPKFSQFHAVCRKIKQNRMKVGAPWRVGASS